MLCSTAAQAFRRKLLPYAVDIRRGYMLFTVHSCSSSLAEKPFIYHAQFDAAEEAIAIPIASLDRYFQIGEPRNVNFVFSVGRCGSTLLAEMLKLVGPVASEPDIYVQLVADRQFSWLRRAERRAAIRGCTSCLIDYFGNSLSIKLRQQCNYIAAEIFAAEPDAAYITILRKLHEWALSTYNAFRNEPGELAWIYARAIKTYAQLDRRGAEPKLIWYEDLTENPTSALLELGCRSLTIEQSVGLKQVMSKDSQQGLSIGRDARSKNSSIPDLCSEVDLAWSKIAPKRLIAHYNLAGKIGATSTAVSVSPPHR